MRLIVNGDDLGYSPAVNRAIFVLHDAGRLDSTSAIVNLPHCVAGLEQARDRPALKLGVHLNLTRGRPLLPAEQIPSLLANDGCFHATPVVFQRAVLGRVDLVQVERETRAQIEKTLAAGLELAHLDSHSHWHLLPRFNQLLKRLATEYQVPRVRTVNLRRTLLPQSLMLSTLEQSLRTDTLPVQTDYLLSLHQWIDNDGRVSPQLFSDRVKKLLANPGVSAELVVHPGFADDPDFPSDTLPTDRRQHEFDFVQSDRFAEWLAAIGAERMTEAEK